MDAKDPNIPKPPSDDASRRNIQRMHNYFAACMDETQHINAGREPLKREIEEMVKIYRVPGSPITPRKGVTIKKDGITGQFFGNGWITFISPPDEHYSASSEMDLSGVIGKLLRDGLVTFFKLSVDQDNDDPTLNRMSLGPGSVGLSAEVRADPVKILAYEQLIGEMFFILYATTDPVAGKDGTVPLVVPQVWKDVANNVVEFEKDFAKFAGFRPQMDAGLRSQMGKKLLPVDEISRRTPSLDWITILRSVYSNGPDAPKEMVVHDEEYLKKLDALLSKTDRLTIQLFLAWSIIRQYGRFLDKAHRRNIDDYKQKSDDDQDNRAEFCYKKTLKIVPDIIGHYFVETTLSKPARDKLEEIIITILESYSTSLQSQESHEWLETSARKGALKKIENLVQVIGYSYSEPDNRSPSSIDQFYSGLDLDGQDHFGNQVRASEFWAKVEFETLNKKFDRMHMKDIPTKNNAYNRRNINGVYFPAGVLQSPLFNVDFPEYLNYGGFGATTGGHEITHTLDNYGVTFDETGRSGSKVSADRD